MRAILALQDVTWYPIEFGKDDVGTGCEGQSHAGRANVPDEELTSAIILESINCDLTVVRLGAVHDLDRRGGLSRHLHRARSELLVESIKNIAVPTEDDHLVAGVVFEKGVDVLDHIRELS